MRELLRAAVVLAGACVLLGSSAAGEASSLVAQIEDVGQLLAEVESLRTVEHAAEDTEGSRRRRRRRRRSSSKSTRRRKSKSSRRRKSKSSRRRSKTSSKKSDGSRRRGSDVPPAPPPSPPPAALVADARANGIEAGWADMAKRDSEFTVFVTGSNFDKNKDRIVVIDGDASCGSASARIAEVTGKGERPGGDFNAWKALPCNAGGASSSKLACGDGRSNGVLFVDDKFIDTYLFKVCVCDFSKRGKCDTMSDFDLTPSRPTLRVDPVI